MEVLLNARGVDALGKNDSLVCAIRNGRDRKVKVLILTPRWTCHEMITCAGVMLRARAISWTSGTLRVSLTSVPLPRGEYASKSKP